MTQYLVVIEGLDGSGKQTQAELLREKLSQSDTVRKISFPNYESPAGELIRMYLNGKFGENASGVDSYAASALYAIDRYVSFKKTWQKDYQQGLIIADRYTTSNMIHQGAKLLNGNEGDSFLKWLDELEYTHFRLPKPNRVIFLDVPLEISADLRRQRMAKFQGKDIHENDDSYLKACYETAKVLAKMFGWNVINCVNNGVLRSPGEISEDIYRIIKEDL